MPSAAKSPKFKLSQLIAIICGKVYNDIMRKIRNHNLAQLLMQLRFAPLRQRQKQLAAAEDLCAMLEAGKDYPFDFICYRITGHSPKEEEQAIINGKDLLSDLQIFISKLSSQIADNAVQYPQKIYTIEELAAKLNVSTKTINRWRKKGLVARKFIVEGGAKRLGFGQDRVEKFAAKNGELIKKAAAFERLDKNKKNEIISCVRNLAKKDMSLRKIILDVAARLGVSAETVRLTIKKYEQEHPGKNPVANVRKMIRPAQAAEVYRLSQQGLSIKELSERFGKCRSTIYRVINQRREKMILAKKIEYIDSPDFNEPQAFDKICGNISRNIEKSKGVDNLLKQFDTGGKEEAMNRQRESELFRKYNFLKFMAAANKEKINLAKVNARLVNRIENCMLLAEAIKKNLTEANMRLVATIAGKHAASGVNMQDLIGEGHISLMRAVEKFDYNRGFRFATYASWVIAKDYARKIPAELAKQKKISDTDIETLHKELKSRFEFKPSDSASLTTIEQAGRDIRQVLRDNLDKREQFIIVNHFGLSGSLVKKEKKTLQQIGNELGLSKERIRQIELTALQKLRQILSSEQFELLTSQS